MGQKIQLKMLYFARFMKKTEIVFAVQKHSIPMSITDFVEMKIFLCLMFFHLCQNVRFLQ